MNAHQLITGSDAIEPLEDGGTWLLDLVAAVDHLRRGIRPSITVWDALEEALRWHAASTDGQDPVEPDWDAPDPLRSTLAGFLDHTTGPANVAAQVAVRQWVMAMADRYNDGRHWPHPASRRSFPTPMLDVDLDDGPIR